MTPQIECPGFNVETCEYVEQLFVRSQWCAPFVAWFDSQRAEWRIYYRYVGESPDNGMCLWMYMDEWESASAHLPRGCEFKTFM